MVSASKGESRYMTGIRMVVEWAGNVLTIAWIWYWTPIGILQALDHSQTIPRQPLDNPWTTALPYVSYPTNKKGTTTVMPSRKLSIKEIA